MKITKRQLRRIIKEELENTTKAENSEGAKTLTDLKSWFIDAARGINELNVPQGQIASLITALEEVIKVASAGRLKSKSDYLGGVMDKLSGNQ